MLAARADGRSGGFDCRSLPWAAIVAVATISVGAVLFVRIPRRRAPLVLEGAGDGRLEELDPIDGTSFGSAEEPGAAKVSTRSR